ncbi:type II secretion system F family protein [Methylotenera sp.]|uniref:type II secretion system F family protein n=1 Tax=Methylotenera sp. TaxID=2051956 RepID=UPI0027312C64|nr:type II secretion system F family protein [Methylotenera sp.]MDP2071315.1 type II secretion system F family protein [Methylotenera sp.]MDP3005232.1 type II secretion system F family protein [Methylotenera sp.]MDP3818134.1 type II secretion system F family protein [Methylotenera sp.]
MNYQVKAVRGKEIILLSISATHADDAFAQVQARGYTPITAKSNSSALSNGQNKKFPLALFSQELLALLEAGLNLVEAIETLAEKEQGNQIKHTLDALLQALYQGQTFSSALEQQPAIFPILYIATVRASEKTGDLPEALSRYVSYEQQLGLVKKKIVSSSIYPILLMVVGGLVILFLLGFVVPKFSRIYEGTGGNLPFLSQVLLAWGLFLESHGKELLVVTGLFIGGLFFGLSQASVRKWITQFIWRIPALGKRLRIFQLARFYRTLGMLLKGGTSIIVALNSVAGLLDAVLQNKMKQASAAIQEGQTISVAMEQAGLTTPIALRMLRVGERGGRIGDMMERIAAFYDDELARWIDWFTKLFEPILMLVIGLVIGVVVLLLYMPIFELAGNIQ